MAQQDIQVSVPIVGIDPSKPVAYAAQVYDEATEQPLSEVARKVDGLATIATSGSYNDLTDKPTIPTPVDVSGKANVSDVYTKVEGQALESEVDQRLDGQDAAIALLNGNDVVVVADHTAVVNPDSQKIYRQYGTNSYTDWMYQNSAWQAIATYSYPGVDEVPTKNSEKFVKSGGVEKAIGDAIDIAKYGYGNIETVGYHINKGGHITFSPITLSQDGDSIEFLYITSVYEMQEASGANEGGGYNFLKATNIGIGLTYSRFAIRADDGTWIQLPESLGIDAHSEYHKIKLSFESGKTCLYVDGTLHREYNTQKTITISGIGGVYAGADSWSGSVKGFTYTHNGVTANIEDLAGFAKDSNIDDISVNQGYVLGINRLNQQSSLYIQYINGSGAGDSTERVAVYTPTKCGFIRYDFVHTVKASINANVWRIQDAYAVDDEFNVIVKLTTDGEWECALKLKNRSDFSGGDAHGDEVVNSIKFFVDGKSVSSLSDYTAITQCKSFEVIQSSTLYDPNDNATAIAIHGNSHLWDVRETDNLVIKQSVKWLISDDIENCFLAMFPPLKTVTSDFYTNVGNNLYKAYCPAKITHYPTDISNVKEARLYSDTAGFSARFAVTKYVDGYPSGNYFSIHDNTQDGSGLYNKCYYYIATSGTVAIGDVWETETRYDLQKSV